MVSEICANPLRNLSGGGISGTNGLTEFVHLSKLAGFCQGSNGDFSGVVAL